MIEFLINNINSLLAGGLLVSAIITIWITHLHNREIKLLTLMENSKESLHRLREEIVKTNSKKEKIKKVLQSHLLDELELISYYINHLSKYVKNHLLYMYHEMIPYYYETYNYKKTKYQEIENALLEIKKYKSQEKHKEKISNNKEEYIKNLIPGISGGAIIVFSGMISEILTHNASIKVWIFLGSLILLTGAHIFAYLKIVK